MCCRVMSVVRNSRCLGRGARLWLAWALSVVVMDVGVRCGVVAGTDVVYLWLWTCACRSCENWRFLHGLDLCGEGGENGIFGAIECSDDVVGKLYQRSRFPHVVECLFPYSPWVVTPWGEGGPVLLARSSGFLPLGGCGESTCGEDSCLLINVVKSGGFE